MTASPSIAGKAIARPSVGLAGEARAPGDKSISHRALILGAMAEGETTARGLLEGDDVLRTAAAMRALGARVERDKGDEGPIWRIEGGAWRAPARPLYMGNSGTGCRLVMGAVAGRGVAARFDGDESLRSRPMGRILDPLALMGVAASSRDGKLPVALEGTQGSLRGVDYALPTPSAQIKSAILLAGLGAAGETVIREPVQCRDHTERMLEAFGAALTIEPQGEGRTIRLAGGQSLKAAEIAVPGDPSSAAFLVAAALIAPGSDILVRDVLVNPLRAGFYETLREMGADIVFENERMQSGEPVADIRARHSALKGVETPAGRAASMIDEYPVLAMLAAFAEGETYMPGVEELRVKESDRMAATEAGLQANGVKTESGPDWLRVFGEGPRGVTGGGLAETRRDHRIAMSFLVMGLGAQSPVEIDDASMIATSFPNFFTLMNDLGADIGPR